MNNNQDQGTYSVFDLEAASRVCSSIFKITSLEESFWNL